MQAPLESPKKSWHFLNDSPRRVKWNLPFMSKLYIIYASSLIYIQFPYRLYGDFGWKRLRSYNHTLFIMIFLLNTIPLHRLRKESGKGRASGLLQAAPLFRLPIAGCSAERSQL